ncbi:MAG: hypothetical protein U9N85_04820 [Bacteroidota bacterium]|nr:hypothetical protein [Bacteroidota bacterium]
MKKIKQISSILFFLFTVISLQSCGWFQEKFQIERLKQDGYITDKETGEAIENVKITILKAEEYFGETEETDYIFYTDEEGYYKIKIDNTDYVYYMQMTHDEYIYPLPQNNTYPQVIVGFPEEAINYEMVKLGPVKIDGDVRHWHDGTFTRLENAKISVLKREIGNTDYPDTTGIKTFSDANGQFYIEYEGDKNYEYFLKPEKEGYYYDKGNVIEDCGESRNHDPGYIIPYGFSMEIDE